ncbi:helicase HerA-like domain-containing protein [Litorihabitans aurantiacus]|uniref:ATPase n=1 Tax=Litorihabitans aurantiacus TaxID=1930061 RepID=A0AA37UWV4_9MICO|nr:helicase HerA-like domain-containing protein [Litorihabitans aurantiacus]GMA30937.1 ATPase [Litorihabitans aurantiacus]
MTDQQPPAPDAASSAAPPDPVSLAQLRAEAARAEAEAAELRAEAARAALAAAEAVHAAQPAESAVAEPAAAQLDEPAEIPSTDEAAPTSPTPDAEQLERPERPDLPLTGHAADVAAAYSFPGGALPLGALVVDGAPEPRAQVAFSLAMLNRHGLVAGATGTGKTRTLQAMAEGLSDAGVPVFLADVKGDLTGMLTPGTPSSALLARTSSLGQDWTPATYPVEPFSLGGVGEGVPIRATVTDVGPLLLARMLGLNATQESSLALIFHWADSQGLALLDLADLRSTIAFLTSDEGRDELRTVGGVSRATAGVVLREIAALQAQGGDAFFGEPAFDTSDLLRTAPDGRGVVSALQLPAVADRPGLYSTFLMWLLADLFADLPEVGDVEKPRLVFFFDEAHLLFTGASKAFLAQIVQTVRLIRSKGVGVVFVTQTPKDVPADVLAQLGNRVQHALRAFTPQDATALRAAVRTYPTSPYDLERLLTSLRTGEAVVTVMSETGAPTPVAWTRVRAPRSAMDVAPDGVVAAAVAASPLRARYADAVDRDSAHEVLARRVAAQEAAAAAAERQVAVEKETREREDDLERMRRRLERDATSRRSSSPGRTTRSTGAPRTGRSSTSPLDAFLRSAGSQLGREITRSIFGTRRR